MQECLTFARLSEVNSDEIVAHMSDPRVSEHLPLASFQWDAETVRTFVRKKEACWDRDGLGHWAILSHAAYIGWGGFQREGDEWDFGLVLRPDAFGLGRQVARKALDFARADARIPYVTFLLPPSRKHFGALYRLGAVFVEEAEYDGETFLKFRLETQ